jgi:hypothetical protein
MPTEPNTSVMTLKLRRLWKGTLYICITGIYTFLLGMLLIYQGWRPALLVLFLIALGQWFRHIANDVDRLGWIMGQNEQSEIQTGEKRLQARMHVLLICLIQLLNIVITIQVFVISTWMWALMVAAAVLVLEIMFGQVRSVNRRMGYESANGIKEQGPLATREAPLQDKEIDGKLAELKKLAETGAVSQKAYEKARDRALVKRVMKG